MLEGFGLAFGGFALVGGLTLVVFKRGRAQGGGYYNKCRFCFGGIGGGRQSLVGGKANPTRAIPTSDPDDMLEGRTAAVVDGELD